MMVNNPTNINKTKVLSWSWLYGSWIYNYPCNQCLSPLMLWVRISIRTRCTTLYDKVCQRLATGWWFSPDPPVSSTNKTEMLLKVALNTIKQTNKQMNNPLSPKINEKKKKTHDKRHWKSRSWLWTGTNMW